MFYLLNEWLPYDLLTSEEEVGSQHEKVAELPAPPRICEVLEAVGVDVDSICAVAGKHYITLCIDHAALVELIGDYALVDKSSHVAVMLVP